MGRASPNGDGRAPAAKRLLAHEGQPHEAAGRVRFKAQEPENLVGVHRCDPRNRRGLSPTVLFDTCL
jgi:hypothetical protein